MLTPSLLLKQVVNPDLLLRVEAGCGSKLKFVVCVETFLRTQMDIYHKGRLPSFGEPCVDWQRFPSGIILNQNSAKYFRFLAPRGPRSGCLSRRGRGCPRSGCLSRRGRGSFSRSWAPLKVRQC